MSIDGFGVFIKFNRVATTMNKKRVAAYFFKVGDRR
jgi:hypothetical protein